MEKYFLYTRKSSEGEDRQVQSIPDQIEVMTAKAKNLGIHIVSIYKEEMSAKTP
jgi:ribosomal protein S15P/S13E